MTSLLSWCADRFCLVAANTLQACNSNQPKKSTTRLKSRRRAHEIDVPALKWLHSTARHHHWRVDPSRDISDLIQDGHMKWVHVVRTYPEITEVKVLMCLFKTAYTRHLHDLSNRKTKMVNTVEELKRACVEEAMDGLTECQAAFDKAPPNVRRVLEAMQTDEGMVSLRLQDDAPSLLYQTCQHFGLEPPTALWSPKQLAHAVAGHFDDWLSLFTEDLSQAARMLPYSAKSSEHRLIKARLKSTRRCDGQDQRHL